MALTSTEQTKIAQLLGYAGKILQSGSVQYNKIFSDRLASLTTDLESLVRGYLTQIAAIETQLAQAPQRLISEKVGDITINLREMEGLRCERKKLAKEMAQLLDLAYLGASANVSVVV